MVLFVMSLSVCVYACMCAYEYGTVKGQESKKGGFISRASYYVGYSPSVSLH